MHGRRYWLLFLRKVRVRLPAVDRATDSVELSTDTGVRLVIRRVYDSFGFVIVRFCCLWSLVCNG
jgi:hypothetical protein